MAEEVIKPKEVVKHEEKITPEETKKEVTNKSNDLLAQPLPPLSS